MNAALITTFTIFLRNPSGNMPYLKIETGVPIFFAIYLTGEKFIGRY
jgi:hypothetical protein